MLNELLILNDCYDDTCPTSIIKIPELMGDIIGVKQVGNITHRLYSPVVKDNARVYTYNFETKQVELDTIIAIDHIIGDFDLFELSSYKSSPVQLTNYEQIMIGRKYPNFKSYFCSCNKLFRKLVLQAVNYNILPMEEFSMWFDNNGEDVDIPMNSNIGILIGYILGSGGVVDYNECEQIAIYPKTADDTNIVLNILSEYLPSVDVTVINGRKTIIAITNKPFIDWFKASHGKGNNMQFPSQYYAAPSDYIVGIIYGLIQTAGKISINHRKNVMYYTIISKSKLFADQLNELLFLYLNISSHSSSFTANNIEYYISNIRVIDEVVEKLGIEITEDQQKFIPSNSKYAPDDYEDLEAILSVRVNKIGKTHETYRLHLKNNNTVIGLNGLIYKAEPGLHL